MGTFLWLAIAGVGLFVLDRSLLWAEARGWIYYRVNKPGRGASTYHLFEWNAAFDPLMRTVQEEQIREEQGEDEDGEPPGPHDDLEPVHGELTSHHHPDPGR